MRVKKWYTTDFGNTVLSEAFKAIEMVGEFYVNN